MTTTATADETRHALYRFYNERMQLLYVGMTNEPWRRWREHVLEKPWYPQVRHWTVSFYDTEDEARRAELKAIRGERARYNIADVPAPVPPSFTVSAHLLTNVCLIWAVTGMCFALVPAFVRWRWLVDVSLVAWLSALFPVAAIWAANLSHPVRKLLELTDRHIVDAPGNAHKPGKS